MGVHVGRIVVPLLAAIDGCHCWVPLLGCHCWVPLLGIGEGGCTRWRIGRGAVAGCHCWAAIAGDRGGVGVQVGGLDVLLGCHCWG